MATKARLNFALVEHSEFNQKIFIDDTENNDSYLSFHSDDAVITQSKIRIEVNPVVASCASLANKRKIRFCVWEKSASSRRSQLHEMIQTESGTYCFERDVLLEEEYGTIQFGTVAIADSNIATGPINNAAGHIIGYCQPFEIRIDKSSEPIGNFLKVKWRDFEVHYPSYKKNVFHLDVDNGQVLYLNNKIDGLYGLFKSTGKVGARSDLKKALYKSIVLDVWKTLVHRALLELSRTIRQHNDGGENNLVLAFEDLGEWELKVLNTWGPRFHPDGDGDSWKLEMINELITAEGFYTMQVSDQIQKSIQISGDFEKLIKGQVAVSIVDAGESL